MLPINKYTHTSTRTHKCDKLHDCSFVCLSINQTSDPDRQVFCSQSTFDLNVAWFKVTTHLVLIKHSHQACENIVQDQTNRIFE